MIPQTQTTSTPSRWLIAVGLIAALTHGGFAFFAPDPGDFAKLASGKNPQASPSIPSTTGTLVSRSPDEREYLDLAVSLADKGSLRLPSGDVAKRLPLYPALLSFIYRTQPPETWHSAAILIQSLMAWCNTLLMALIAARISDHRAGLFAGLIAALYAPLLYLQTLFLTETLIIFLMLSATLIYLTTLFGGNSSLHSDVADSSDRRVQNGNVNPAIHFEHTASTRALPKLLLTSALIGLAALARPNAILFLVPFIAHQLHHQIRMRGPYFKCAVLMTLPAALLLGAWVYRNQQLLGRPTLSTIGGLNLYLGHNPDYARKPGLDNADYDRYDRIRLEQRLTELEADDQLHEEAWRYIRDNPGQTLRSSFTKIKVWFTPTIPSFGPLLPLLLTGICLVAAWQRRAEPSTQNPASKVKTPETVGHANGLRDKLALQPLTTWRYLIAIAFAAALAAYVGHLTSDTYRKLPLVAPVHVLLIGIPALTWLRTHPPVRGLFMAIVASQLIVAVLYIPLSRIRWTIDPFFIIAIAVAMSHLCNFLRVKRVAQ